MLIISHIRREKHFSSLALSASSLTGPASTRRKRLPLSMNATNHSSSPSEEACFRADVPNDEYFTADYVLAVLGITLNFIVCPLIIIGNALVIITVTKSRRLHTNHHTLLACLAVTDLMVGILAQPTFIAQEIYRLSNSPRYFFCNIYSITTVAMHILSLASLFHLMLISVDRFVAIKYSLRYETIVTKFRLFIAVASSWLSSMLVYLLKSTVPGLAELPAVTVTSTLLVIIFCHLSVYVVCRHHIIQIKCQHVSEEERTKFAREKKAWVTTSIIVGVLFMCFLPGLLRVVALRIAMATTFLPQRLAVIPWPVTVFFVISNSLYNPMIYCWRSTVLREALLQLLRKQNN